LVFMSSCMVSILASRSSNTRDSISFVWFRVSSSIPLLWCQCYVLTAWRDTYRLHGSLDRNKSFYWTRTVMYHLQCLNYCSSCFGSVAWL
jgi:hypothetical protein